MVMKRMSPRIGSRDKRTQKPISQQCLALPQYHLPTEDVSLHREWGPGGCRGEKLTRARKEEDEMGLGLSPYYTSDLSRSTCAPPSIANKSGPRVGLQCTSK